MGAGVASSSFRVPFLLRVSLVLGICAALAYLLVVVDDNPKPPRPSGVPAGARVSTPPRKEKQHSPTDGTLHKDDDEIEMTTSASAMYSIWLEPPTGSPTAGL